MTFPPIVPGTLADSGGPGVSQMEFRFHFADRLLVGFTAVVAIVGAWPRRHPPPRSPIRPGADAELERVFTAVAEGVRYEPYRGIARDAATTALMGSGTVSTSRCCWPNGSAPRGTRSDSYADTWSRTTSESCCGGCTRLGCPGRWWATSTRRSTRRRIPSCAVPPRITSGWRSSRETTGSPWTPRIPEPGSARRTHGRGNVPGARGGGPPKGHPRAARE